MSDLTRFLDAQSGGVYERALEEIRSGRKRTHWMWFIFPQIAGLGHSPTAQHYAIRDLDEASEYLRDPVLGTRLVECARAAAAIEGKSARDVFGSPDDLKLRSSATLFSLVAPPDSIFDTLLAHYYNGERDPLTLRAAGKDQR